MHLGHLADMIKMNTMMMLRDVSERNNQRNRWSGTFSPVRIFSVVLVPHLIK